MFHLEARVDPYTSGYCTLRLIGPLFSALPESERKLLARRLLAEEQDIKL